MVRGLTCFERYFSPAVATPQSRQTFAANILKMYTTYNIDGIDIDWEFPGQAGDDGNNVSADDSANYLAFLQLLRQTLPPQAKISAATMTVPWADAKGQPLKDVSAFGQVLDWILIMNYDTWGCKCCSFRPVDLLVPYADYVCPSFDGHARTECSAEQCMQELDAERCKRSCRSPSMDGSWLPCKQDRARPTLLWLHLAHIRQLPSNSLS